MVTTKYLWAGACFATLLMLPSARAGDSDSVDRQSIQSEYVSQPFIADPSPFTHEVRDALMGKSKTEVKAYFGRPPDRAPTPDFWYYVQDFYDRDSEKTMKMCVIQFNNEKATGVGFSDH